MSFAPHAPADRFSAVLLARMDAAAIDISIHGLIRIRLDR
jgi:hypothetical protein